MTPQPDILAEVARLRQLQAAGRHPEVIAAVTVRLGELPENRDLLLLLAISLRTTGRVDEALAALDTLTTHHPDYSLLHQERRLCLVARKDARRSVEALLQAVNRNPALPLSWQMLEGVYRIMGDTANAATAAAHVAALRALRPEVIAATSLFADGDLGPAEAMIRALLVRHDDDAEGMRLLAKIDMAHDVP